MLRAILLILAIAFVVPPTSAGVIEEGLTALPALSLTPDVELAAIDEMTETDYTLWRDDAADYQVNAEEDWPTPAHISPQILFANDGILVEDGADGAGLLACYLWDRETCVPRYRPG